MPSTQTDPRHNRGRNSEEVASWYLRLNGFLSIPGVVVHLDTATAQEDRRGRLNVIARTDADLLAVRFPSSMEVINGRPLVDEFSSARVGAEHEGKILFVIAEVKTSDCAMNGPWTDSSRKNMQRVIRRLGFARKESAIEEVAAALYQRARWVGSNFVAQYVCFGSTASPTLQRGYEDLIQIEWREIAAFLYRRFSDHPEKTPSGKVHDGWPDFGRKFGIWFSKGGRQLGAEGAHAAVNRYIESGRCVDPNVPRSMD